MSINSVAGVDLLFSKTDWVLADLTANTFAFSDGTFGTTFNGGPAFDLRAYRAVQCLVYCAALTGGTTPAFQFNCWGVDGPGKPWGASGWSSQAAANVAAAGGPAMLILGDSGASPAYSASANFVNGYPVTLAHRALFGIFQVSVSGAPTGGAATVRTLVYGIH